jgi:hypothetical protein
MLLDIKSNASNSSIGHRHMQGFDCITIVLLIESPLLASTRVEVWPSSIQAASFLHVSRLEA